MTLTELLRSLPHNTSFGGEITERQFALAHADHIRGQCHRCQLQPIAEALTALVAKLPHHVYADNCVHKVSSVTVGAECPRCEGEGILGK